jgi:hypothetical protein
MEENNNIEIWKDIKDFEGLYQVSNLGRVRSLKNGKVYVFKEHIDNHGYAYGFLYISRKHKPRQIRFKTHKLVAKYFCEGYAEGLVVDHIDGNKRNNVYTNLEWVTPSENNRRAYALGLKSRTISEKQKQALDRVHESMSIPISATNIHTGEKLVFKSYKEAAKYLNITDTGIAYNIRTNTINRKGYKFEKI